VPRQAMFALATTLVIADLPNLNPVGTPACLR
jgi:hypothetical protein